MTFRQERLTEVRDALAGRRVAWFGIRGIDAAPLWRCGMLDYVASEVCPLAEEIGSGKLEEDCLETRMRRRVDHNRYDIDTDEHREAFAFRQELLARRHGAGNDQDWALIAYRPAAFLSAINFTRSEVLPCFMFAGAQRMFEHKPWVEREFEKLGLATIGWKYVRDSEEHLIHRALEKLGKVVVRSSYTSGGVGVRLIKSASEVRQNMPIHNDGFVGFSPLLDGAVPLNLNACVYRDRQVRTFHVSLQLIGLEACTQLAFGFCGNDLAAAAELDPAILTKAELVAERAGRWAADHGYLGQFGLDLLVHDGKLLITEMNPRFQASTVLSEEVASAQEGAGPYIEHLAAFLGLDPPSTSQMPDVVTQSQNCAALKGLCSLSQIICYNDRGNEVRMVGQDSSVLPPNVRLSGVAANNVRVSCNAMLGKVFAKERVTTDGYTLIDAYSRVRNVFHTSQILF